MRGWRVQSLTPFWPTNPPAGGVVLPAEMRIHPEIQALEITRAGQKQLSAVAFLRSLLSWLRLNFD